MPLLVNEDGIVPSPVNKDEIVRYCNSQSPEMRSTGGSLYVPNSLIIGRIKGIFESSPKS